MIIELNTNLLDIIPEQINLNQLVFLSMVLNKNQKYNDQDVHKLVSLISDDEISYLIQKNLITSMERRGFTYYDPSQYLLSLLEPKKDWFDTFYDAYPIYVTRKNGLKSFLRTNKNKCRKIFNDYVQGIESNAKHLLECLNFEVQKKTLAGELGFMKTMYRWLQEHSWEAIEEEMQYQQSIKEKSYGTELL
jgi:hypothetical protein